MGLQIRVRHALGERMMELPDRTLDQPIAVGRSSGADVQIPSVTVGPRHCALFVHEGHWVVQDLGAGAGGTKVNGRPLEKAKRLKIGDVIEVGAEGTGARIEVDPAAAAAGRTGYAGGGAARDATARPPAAGPQLVPPAAAGGGGYPVPPAGYPPQPGYAVPQPGPAVPPSHVPPQYVPPQYAQPPYAAEQYAQAGYAEGQGDYVAGAAGDEIAGFQPAADVGYARPRKKPRSGAGAMVAVMIVTTLAIGGVVGWAVWRAKTQVPVVIKKPDQTIVIKADTRPAPPPRMFDLPPGAGPGPGPGPDAGAAAAAGQPGPATGSGPAGATPPPSAAGDTPSTQPAVAGPAGGGASGGAPKSDGDGMDTVRKPAGTGGAARPVSPPAGDGGAEDGMDVVRKPAAPPKPAGLDPETLPPAAAQSWDAMQQLAAQAGKESFAVLRFEEFRKNNPGKHDADLDAFVDKKMDRLWWERVDHLFKRIEALKVDIPKLRLELADVNDPAVKKKMLDSHKAMEAELAESNKVLREQMGYGETAPPNLGSGSELAALSQKRDKGKYEGWKKATLYQIKTNQGRLPWAGT